MRKPAAPHLYPDTDTEPPMAASDIASLAPARATKRWVPRRVLITPSAAKLEYGRAVASRAAALGSDVVELRADRVTGLRSHDPREEYARAKSTLAIVVAPGSKRTVQPIPPSADWRVDLAEGCPAHCQYCYLAGSLAGPPITRVYANLDEIVDNLRGYAGRGAVTSRSRHRSAEGKTFEASCYTDPLALEHLTGGLSRAIAFFGTWNDDVQLRWTTKFDDVDPFLPLAHYGRTRIRFSVNARPITRRFEGGTASLDGRIGALRRCAQAGYPLGLTIAPIFPLDDWRSAYDDLLSAVADATADIAGLDLTVECITHRFTDVSRDVLRAWYPHSELEMDPERRTAKRTKFGAIKQVFPKETMRELRDFFEAAIARRLPRANILYWT